MNKIRKGDEVVVITGRDKGKRGVVLARVDEQHLLVEGINLVKKHQKPNPMKGEQGGIVDKAMPIDQSNVALYNPATQKADRVAIQIQEDGKKIRVFKSSKAPVPSTVA
ncbi:MAG: 50S ribosomal protein L24 [Betaproteobacteria bacterium]|nr:50S ribosomal protein L24 [Betaproteobacteria bacterium]NBT75876.1 50S ribosomal protein L24 [Betaproteobacteria bacterium]NBY14522.1 50S ribosomal protein L24 [Betaproteobacteria bacterium]NCA16149.1 50S ribosomal protein L24 [Betaproteobacteria bacterium]NDF04312.1 50S ribosomal protein L24 [Betaproteobacteria bacterium]